MGAIASGGVRILNETVVHDLGISEDELASATAEQEAELQRREELFRGVRPPVSVQQKVAILVDDGIATGSSIRAAIDALRTLHPKKIVVATPVAPAHAATRVKGAADEFVSLLTPEWFFGIGEFYERFPQIEDAEVRELLSRAGKPAASVKGAA
jgi:putative phosphoribosyl transferase